MNNPLTARWRYRNPNLAFIFCSWPYFFIPMVFVNFILPFVIDCPEILLFILTFAICGAWFLYFLLRMDDAVLIRCNNCGKDIETDRSEEHTSELQSLRH